MRVEIGAVNSYSRNRDNYVIIEYLFIKRRDKKFAPTIENFKGWFSFEDSAYSFNENRIVFEDTKFEYEINLEEVEWNGKVEMVFHFTVYLSDKSRINVFEKLDELIHSHNTQAGTIFNIYTIWDDISIYYAKNLFPDINKIENLFKKVIYRFMIKVAGSTWTTTVLPKDIRKNLNEMAKSNGLTGLPDEDQLEFAYFDTLEEILFFPYSSRQYDQAKMVSILKDYVDTDSLNKKVRELIEACEAKSNYERYFSNADGINDLEDNWKELSKFRNSVVHTKHLRNADYEQTKALIKALLPAIESCLEQVKYVKMTKEEAEAAKKFAQAKMEERIQRAEAELEQIRGGYPTARPFYIAPMSYSIGGGFASLR